MNRGETEKGKDGGKRAPGPVPRPESGNKAPALLAEKKGTQSEGNNKSAKKGTVEEGRRGHIRRKVCRSPRVGHWGSRRPGRIRTRDWLRYVGIRKGFPQNDRLPPVQKAKTGLKVRPQEKWPENMGIGRQHFAVYLIVREPARKETPFYAVDTKDKEEGTRNQRNDGAFVGEGFGRLGEEGGTRRQWFKPG